MQGKKYYGKITAYCGRDRDTGMEQRGFTKDCSLAAKGVFIMMLLFHHLFVGETLWEKDILTLFDRFYMAGLSMYGKVCVSGFAFISAYGITKQLMKREPVCAKSMAALCIQRVIKLESMCLFIFPIAILYRKFVAHQPVEALYYINEKFQPALVILDAVGLADFFGMPTLNVTWWYLSFALLLTLSLPAWYLLYKRIGWPLLFLAVLVIPDGKIVSVIFGTACACDGWFEKLEGRMMSSGKNKIAGAVLLFLLLWLSFEIVLRKGDADGILWGAGALICFIVMLTVSKVPVLAPVLKFIGRHSGNIFLIHTFIYHYFYEDFIYSFKRAGLIWLVLLLCSLAVSVLLEAIKKMIRYPVFITKTADFLCKKLVTAWQPQTDSPAGRGKTVNTV